MQRPNLRTNTKIIMKGRNNIAKRWAVCKCFYEKNIYISNLGKSIYSKKLKLPKIELFKGGGGG